MEAKPTFIPVLSVGNGITDIEFYKNAFNAETLWRLNNSDGSVHVAALSINGTEFRLHEQSQDGHNASPAKAGCTTVTVGLAVDDVHAVVADAVNAGAVVVSAVTDYDYGYRQGEIKDPFGHHWLVEKLLNGEALSRFLEGK